MDPRLVAALQRFQADRAEEEGTPPAAHQAHDEELHLAALLHVTEDRAEEAVRRLALAEGVPPEEWARVHLPQLRSAVADALWAARQPKMRVMTADVRGSPRISTTPTSRNARLSLTTRNLPASPRQRFPRVMTARSASAAGSRSDGDKGLPTPRPPSRSSTSEGWRSLENAEDAEGDSQRQRTPRWVRSIEDTPLNASATPWRPSGRLTPWSDSQELGRMTSPRIARLNTRPYISMYSGICKCCGKSRCSNSKFQFARNFLMLPKDDPPPRAAAREPAPADPRTGMCFGLLGPVIHAGPVGGQLPQRDFPMVPQDDPPPPKVITAGEPVGLSDERQVRQLGLITPSKSGLMDRCWLGR